MVHCYCFNCRYVHAVCDENIDIQLIQKQKEDGIAVDYVCPVCKNRDPAQVSPALNLFLVP